jgi:hypothetical protein
MAPKRKADSDAESHDEAPKAKKKATKEPLKPLDPSQPINRTFPPTLSLKPREEGFLRFASTRLVLATTTVYTSGPAWNVCGLKAVS